MNNQNNNFQTDQHGWAELIAPRKPTEPLKGSHQVPWVVVGAGITGLSCARQLAALHPDQDILLLEARAVSQGASGRNSGFAVAHSRFGGDFNEKNADAYRRVNNINQSGLDLLRDQVKDNNVDCQWQDEGFIHAAADQAAIKEYTRYLGYLKNLDIDHTPLSDSELQQCLGSNHYKAGVRVHHGALMQPATMVQGLSDTLPENVKLFEHTPVLEFKAGSPIVLKTPLAEITTDKLIFATNYEVTKHGILNRYLTGLTLSASITRVLTDAEFASLGSLKEWGILSLHDTGATVRLTQDRRICIRNTAEFKNVSLLSESELAQRKIVHRLSFEQRFPQLAEVPFEFSWSGVEGISRNTTNFFGEHEDNIYFAGGYNGSGLSRGVAFGTSIAKYANGENCPLVSDCLASEAAKWMPPQPLLGLAGNLSVRLHSKGLGADL